MLMNSNWPGNGIGTGSISLVIILVLGMRLGGLGTGSLVLGMRLETVSVLDHWYWE